jgi:hypothetical protein
MRLKKSVRLKKSTPRSKKSAHFTATVGQQAAVLVAIGVVAAAAMLIAMRHSSPMSDVAAVDFQQEKVTAHARAKNASDAPAGPFLDTTLAADTTAANMADVDPAKTSARKGAPVTITGCLEHAHETFRLKDTSGVEAAKSRSWKSGFFKKSAASIEVVDGANRLQLPTHVGQRVSVTGLLVDREMQGRSLKRIAVSCDIEPVQGTGLKTVARGEP